MTPGWRCGTIRSTPASSSGAASTTWASPAVGRRWPPRRPARPHRHAQADGLRAAELVVEKPMVYAVRRTAGRLSSPIDPGYTAAGTATGYLSDWTPANRDPHEENVEVYSNCERVELFLNGKSLGSQARHADDSARTWKVAYEPGTLKAVGKKGSQTMATYELKTAGKAAKVVLAADRTRLAPGWDNVHVVAARVVDANGTTGPERQDVIAFKVTGPANIAAVDNGDNTSHECIPGRPANCLSGPMRRHPEGDRRLRSDHAHGVRTRPDTRLGNDPCLCRKLRDAISNLRSQISIFPYASCRARAGVGLRAAAACGCGWTWG